MTEYKCKVCGFITDHDDKYPIEMCGCFNCGSSSKVLASRQGTARFNVPGKTSGFVTNQNTLRDL